MLTRPVHRVLDAVFLRISAGDTLRADELRDRAAGAFHAFIVISYLPVVIAVGLLVMTRPTRIDEAAERDQLSAVEAYATHFVDTYLQDPSNSAAIKAFYDGDVPASALPPGGRALRASSALPGVELDGFRTYSVVVDAEIPKAATSASMVFVRLQVDVSADGHNLFRAFTLPHARPDRPAGTAVELATQTMVADDRPVYRTVAGFLSAMLTGRGDLAPYIAAGSGLSAATSPRFTTLVIERVMTNSDLATAQDVPAKADNIEVTARAVLQTASGVLLPMDFPLVLSVAGGHWQIDRINDAPSILATTDAGSTPNTPPTTTSTSPSPLAPEGSQ